MILLESNNQLLQDTLKNIFKAEKREKLFHNLVDFDGVSYQISTPDTVDEVLLSMRWTCYNQLKEYDVETILKNKFANYWSNTPETQFDVTLKFDLNNLPEDLDTLLAELGQLKRHALSAPFQLAFQRQKSGEANSPPMVVNYREGEAIYVHSQVDRVTVIFTVTFKEEMDRIFGKVFLQEFVDARRQSAIQNAPQVIYSSRDPPAELKNAKGLIEGKDIGYVTFVLEPRHYQTEESEEKTINLIQMFRDYLHYHIKCSKAYMHSRMRARVSEFLKVLTRAKPEKASQEKKTVTGRTFRRAV